MFDRFDWLASSLVGVGQPRAPIEPLADVGSADARCADIECPEGVSR
jgi:hypothetical protein